MDFTRHCPRRNLVGGAPLLDFGRIEAEIAGSAAAYEGLLAGRTVCLTEITDWVGGQISAQGTAALDERKTQRDRLFFPRGYLELRRGIKEHYGILNPGKCWVSESCFFPYDGHKQLFEILKD